MCSWNRTKPHTTKIDVSKNKKIIELDMSTLAWPSRALGDCHRRIQVFGDTSVCWWPPSADITKDWN